jgi:hypothetical protein
MNIFSLIALATLAALLPAALAGSIFWAAFRDTTRLTRGEVPRGFFIRERRA